MRIGAQMFTTRDSCQTLEGFAETLRRIADIGYEYVQVSGTCPFEAEWLKAELAKNGLKCVLTHTPVPRLTGELDQVLSDHKTFGCSNIGLGYWTFDPEQDMSLEKWLETFVPVAKAIHQGGAYFMYHNHDGEFFPNKDGQIIYDELTSHTNCGLEIDTYWAYVGKQDPVATLERLKHRMRVIHLKDGSADGHGKALGEGTAPVVAVREKAIELGLKMVVESETCDPTGIEEVGRCIKFLRSLDS